MITGSEIEVKSITQKVVTAIIDLQDGSRIAGTIKDVIVEKNLEFMHSQGIIREARQGLAKIIIYSQILGTHNIDCSLITSISLDEVKMEIQKNNPISLVNMIKQFKEIQNEK